MPEAVPPATPAPAPAAAARHPLRFHLPLAHLGPTFGTDGFALRAEAFARFFGTPLFLGGQTLVVMVWIALNVAGFTRFDAYPFILLNLAFSLQAAYAAPLILLAQTRQAARDKAHAEADARHREDLATANAERQAVVGEDTQRLLLLLAQNTQLTTLTQALAARIEALTLEMHHHVLHHGERPAPSADMAVKAPG
jgi:uncharacterized membrane protein